MQNIDALQIHLARLMRISSVLVFVSCLAIGAVKANPSKAQDLMSTKISARFQNEPLKTALSKLGELGNVGFAYNPSDIPFMQKINLQVKRKPLDATLHLLLDPLRLTYALVGDKIVIEPAAKEAPLAYRSLAMRKPDPLHGKVLDASGAGPLPGVSIRVKGSSQGTISDAAGNFNLEVSPGATLVVSFIGYTEREIKVSNTSQALTILLSSESKNLTNVVVIGYGTRQKKDVTGAISSIGSADIEKSTALSPQLAMQGTMAGVSVTNTSGDPTSRPNIFIRGQNTFNFSEPLYVVDGIPLTEGGNSSTDARVQDLRGPVNVLSLISADDIESISVLKDASSAAIYGVRASNGVVLITTKKGKKGRARIDFSAYGGEQNVPRLNHSMLNTQQFVNYYTNYYNLNPDLDPKTKAVVPIGQQTSNFGPQYDPASPMYRGNMPTYDWRNKLIQKNGLINDYNLRVSGASDNSSYYVSMGYNKTQGSLIANNVARYSLASNVTSRIGKYFEAGMNLHLSQEEVVQNTGYGVDLRSTERTPPWQPIYSTTDPTGFAPVSSATIAPNLKYDPTVIGSEKYTFSAITPLLYGNGTQSNPFGAQSLDDTRYKIQRAFGNAYLQLEPISGLKLKGTLSGDIFTNTRDQFTTIGDWRFSQTPSDPFQNQDGSSLGTYEQRIVTNKNLVKEASAEYTHQFGKHSLDILVDASDQTYSALANDANTGQLNSLNVNERYFLSTPPYSSSLVSQVAQYSLEGYLGRVSYKYADKYYLDATVRRDGSSRFAPGYRWGTFPSFAAAWRLTGEDFMQNVHFLNDLKIRGGYGILGNQEATDGFQYLSGVSSAPHGSFGSGNGNGFGNVYIGAALPSFANKVLTWERLKTTNIGFDAVLLNNHLNFTAEYYYKYTSNIIQVVQLPANSGILTRSAINIGNVSNKGLEFQLSYANNAGALHYNVGANLTTQKNKVLSLYQHSPFGGTIANTTIEEGQSINSLYGYKVGGIFQNQAQVTAYQAKFKDQGATSQAPGDFYFQDVYGNPKPGQVHNPVQNDTINNNDRTNLGNTIPGYFYGFNIHLDYHGFDLGAYFQGVGDVYKENQPKEQGFEGNGLNQWTDVLGQWSSSNTGSSIPVQRFRDPAGNNRFSSFYVERGDYLRLKNLQIGYSIPKQTLAQMGGFVQAFRIYVGGTNLLTFTKYSGYDPETTNEFFPITRQYILGLNVSF